MKIFVCYSSTDKSTVQQITEYLRIATYDVWIDGLLRVGQDWKKILLAEITKCDVFLYTLSPESVESQWCKWEYDKAVELGKPVLPVLLRKGTKIPFPLDEYQYADFSQGITIQRFAALIGGLNNSNEFVVAPDRARVALEEPSITDIPAQVSGEAKVIVVSNTTKQKTDEESLEGEVLNFVEDNVLSEMPAFETWTSKILTLLPPPFDWCFIPSGFITISKPSLRSNSTKARNMQETLSQFIIAKYPVTNSQFQVFIKAEDGYQNEDWWDFSSHAELWRSRNTRSIATSFKGDKIPRTNVSWYTAQAFCRWLSSRTDLNITLPSSNQWQRAAQGDDKHEYPWGDEFYSTRCNVNGTTYPAYTGSRIAPYVGRISDSDKKPTSVDKFPKGQSPFGVADMAGNAWEWCSETSSNAQRIIRGGSFRDDEDEARCTYSSQSNPATEQDNIGFRISLNLKN